jgi:hypothetical protein
LIRIQERVLDHIPGIFRIVQKPKDRVIKPILITADQLAKGLGPALQTVFYQAVVVAGHSYVLGFGRGYDRKVPK